MLCEIYVNMLLLAVTISCNLVDNKITKLLSNHLQRLELRNFCQEALRSQGFESVTHARKINHLQVMSLAFVTNFARKLPHLYWSCHIA